MCSARLGADVDTDEKGHLIEVRRERYGYIKLTLAGWPIHLSRTIWLLFNSTPIS